MRISSWQRAHNSYLDSLAINPLHDATLGYMLSDRLLEETIELIAVSFLHSGVLVMAMRLNKICR